MTDVYDAYVDPNYYTLNSPDHNVLRRVVVQKGNVASRYIYAEQLWNSQQDIYVFRADKESYVSVLIRNLMFLLTRTILF